MKYSAQALRVMALEFIAARAIGDKRAGMVLMMLSLATNTPQDECLIKIQMLAEGFPV